MYLTVNRTLLLGLGAFAIMLCGPYAADAGSLTISNPGFEADTAPVVGASGWTITSGGTDFFTTTAGQPDSTVDPAAAAEGINWLSGNRLVTGAGSSSNPQTIEQLLDISADAAMIDSGAAFLNLDFFFADNDPNDDGTVTARFFSDVAGTVAVGTDITTGIIAETASEGGYDTRALWEPRNLVGAVPASARSVAIELKISRLSGSAGNVHFDDFSGAIVPEPATCGLMVLGFMALGWVRRRS